MGNILRNNTRKVDIEPDICHMLSDDVTKEGEHLDKRLGLFRPPVLTDQDWVSIMDKGPSQWSLTLPQPEVLAVLKATKAGKTAGAKPGGPPQRRKFGSVLGYIRPDGCTENGVQDGNKKPNELGQESKAGTKSTGCDIEVLQEGCCTIRYDTMRSVDTTVNGTPEGARFSPVLPKKSNGGYSGRSLLVKSEPVVVQSTLPLPQQAEVYCEVELLSHEPFKSYVAIGVAHKPFPPNQLPGILPNSFALLSSGQAYGGSTASESDGPVLLEGDVIGCLFCRRTGRIIFFLNGVPTWRLESSAILLSNNNDDLTPRKIDALDMGTQVPTRTGLSPPNAAEDMFFTVGVVGTGEIEVNFGGKNFNLSGEISQVSKGEVESTAPIAARAFGYRLQSFHIMHDELRLFYQCFCPPMVPKAKGMVVLNVSRQEQFNKELKKTYGKDLSDVREESREINKRKLENFFRLHDPARLPQTGRIFEDFNGDSWRLNEFLRKTYGKDMLPCSVRRKKSLELMLHDYFEVQNVKMDSAKVELAAQQALEKPTVVDKFLREKYGEGINVLLKNRLRQLYTAHSPESLKELDQVVETYPLFDDMYLLNIKMRLRYDLDIESYSATKTNVDMDTKESGNIARASTSDTGGVTHEGPGLRLTNTNSKDMPPPSLQATAGESSKTHEHRAKAIEKGTWKSSRSGSHETRSSTTGKNDETEVASVPKKSILRSKFSRSLRSRDSMTPEQMMATASMGDGSFNKTYRNLKAQGDRDTVVVERKVGSTSQTPENVSTKPVECLVETQQTPRLLATNANGTCESATVKEGSTSTTVPSGNAHKKSVEYTKGTSEETPVCLESGNQGVTLADPDPEGINALRNDGGASQKDDESFIRQEVHTRKGESTEPVQDDGNHSSSHKIQNNSTVFDGDTMGEIQKP